MTHRILLCDDELHILRAAEFKFKRAGYEVDCASDGEEAWKKINQRLPDLLITDYQMPRLDGLQLTERVRSNPHTASLPIIMLTAKGFELPHQEIVAKWNIISLLSKPFSPRELLHSVDEVLRSKEASATT